MLLVWLVFVYGGFAWIAVVCACLLCCMFGVLLSVLLVVCCVVRVGVGYSVIALVLRLFELL